MCVAPTIFHGPTPHQFAGVAVQVDQSAMYKQVPLGEHGNWHFGGCILLVLCVDLPFTVYVYIINECPLFFVYILYSYKWADDGRCIRFHTNIRYIFYISLDLYLSLYNFAILQIRFKYTLCHFILLLLYQLLQSYLHMWLRVFGRFMRVDSFLVCVPPNRTWYVYLQHFKLSGFIALHPAFANNDHTRVGGWVFFC